MEKNSPAQRSGVKEGDIIISFKEKNISGIDDLHKMLGENETGIKSELKVLRGTEVKTLHIIPEEQRQRD